MCKNILFHDLSIIGDKKKKTHILFLQRSLNPYEIVTCLTASFLKRKMRSSVFSFPWFLILSWDKAQWIEQLSCPTLLGGSLGPRLTGQSPYLRNRKWQSRWDGQDFLKEMCPSLSTLPHSTATTTLILLHLLARPVRESRTADLVFWCSCFLHLNESIIIIFFFLKKRDFWILLECMYKYEPEMPWPLTCFPCYH